MNGDELTQHIDDILDDILQQWREQVEDAPEYDVASLRFLAIQLRKLEEQVRYL